MKEGKSICVFCSSSSAVAPAYFEAAVELGRLMAIQNHTLVYGGTNVGLMGTVAKAVRQNGGRVIGVIPASIRDMGIACESVDEMVVTADLRERKAVMESRSDAFVALPGGFGTLEEVLEVLTLRQLGLHLKPIVLLNTNGIYDHLLELFEQLYRERFAKPGHRELYHVAQDVAGVFSHIDSYRPTPAESKLF